MEASRSNCCIANKLLLLNFETQGDIGAKGLAPCPGSVTHCYVIMHKSLTLYSSFKWNSYYYSCIFFSTWNKK